MEATEGLCGNGLAPTPAEPSSPSQYRSTSRGAGLPSSQFYSLHTLDDVPYPTPFQLAAGFPYSEPAAKLPGLPIEDHESAQSALTADTLPWAKEDATGAWSHCDIRRTF